jgi:hypothetical protein
MNLVAYRMLACLEVSQTQTLNAIDAITGGMPQLFNGTTPFLILMPNQTNSANIMGQYIETQG